jgi:hypothetical protein
MANSISYENLPTRFGDAPKNQQETYLVSSVSIAGLMARLPEKIYVPELFAFRF